jgi:iron complex outermembrane receptor protein
MRSERRLGTGSALGGLIGLVTLFGVSGVARAEARSIEDLRDLSIEQLANVEVTSVSKTSEALLDAPASIYVISHDDIVRSGASRMADILRLAPNLEVFQTSANHFVVTARGFSGNNADQSFSNKLLVLIDGRTAYSPLFSGVYWDQQEVPPETIDRIEVISGPGAALWGANAVNGVINIITRPAAETLGVLVDADVGDRQRGIGLQYGGRLGSTLTYRLYGRDSREADTVTSTGASAHDHGSNLQGGGRLDWSPNTVDAVTLQGDVYRGAEAQAGAGDEIVHGANILGRWSHGWRGGGMLQVQAYWDRAGRTTVGGGRFVVDTYDLDVQSTFDLGPVNELVVGAGARRASYDIHGAGGLAFSPASGNLDLVNAFVQDSFHLSDAITLVGGLKLERDPYSGVSALPSLRASWRIDQGLMTWAAVSRAIRAPTPFDTSVVETFRSIDYLNGAPNFQPETLTAYEVGTRLQPSRRLSVSLAGYYNVYDDLRTLEPTAGTFVPLAWANGMAGHTWGFEAWSDYRIAPWWRLTATFTLLRERLRFKPGASGLLGVAQAGDDPPQQASLRSSLALGHAVSLDTDLRWVDALPNPAVPSYAELDARLAWALSDRVQISVSGRNLLHEHHQEFPAPGASAVPRSVYADVRLRF